MALISYKVLLVVAVSLVITVIVFITLAKKNNEMDSFVEQRLQMVSSQIESRGVKDPLVLKAMREVPRHEFVPDSQKSRAYGDYPLPIGEGQTISQPYIVALMTELLELHGTEKVLEIGTGSGYQAAILAELAKEVYTIEIIESLSVRSQAILDKLGYKNIYYRVGDGYRGWPEKAPFDGIIVTAAPPTIPQPLLDQLKVGGILIIPVGEYFQELVKVVRTEKGYKHYSVTGVRFVPMTGEAQEKK
jgi:protein-L-isoaspartate(D-aspartate) O-methyltransferase